MAPAGLAEPTPALKARMDRVAKVGQPAPDFTLPDLAGQIHTLSDYRGKKVLLVAYASW